MLAAYEAVLVIFLGLILGSFSTAVIYRVPRGLPWAFALKEQSSGDITAYRSACTHCKTQLKLTDLIPLFSWLFARGRCKHCGEAIGFIYPLIELSVVLCAVLVHGQFGFTAQGFVIMALIPFLMALLVIDLQYFILPNQLVAIVFGLGIVALGVKLLESAGSNIQPLILQHLTGAAIFAAFSWFLGWLMSKLLNKDALGFGDVKFFAAAGLWLGASALPSFCILSGLLGVGCGLAWQIIKKDKVFPFGPALILSFFILLLFDGSLLV